MFKAMKIKHQLVLLTGFLFAALVAGGMIGLMGMQDANDGLESVYRDRVLPLAHLLHLQKAYSRTSGTVQQLHDEKLGWDATARVVSEAQETAEKEWSTYRELDHSGKEARLAEQTAQQLQAAGVMVQHLQKILSARDPQALNRLVDEELFPAITPLSESLTQLANLQTDVAAAVHDKALEDYLLHRNIYLLILALGVGLGILLGWAILNNVGGSLQGLIQATRRLADGDLETLLEVREGTEFGVLANAFNDMGRSMRESRDRELAQMQYLQEHVGSLRDHVAKVAAGDLRHQLDVSGDDDLAVLGGNLNAMTESLARVAGDIRQASNEMVTTLAEVTSATSAQAAAASQQASAVNETTTTLEEIRATSTQTQEKAGQLGQTAERTRREGQQGQEAVQEAGSGMERIRERVEDIAKTILALSEQTQQIGEITEVVTGLAQQSKMLALNASIEAAKAGEAGKGFAVVAAEVKELAEQSQQSTSQVQQILQDIRHATDKAVMATEEGTKEVETGLSLVERTGEVMQSLNGVIKDSAMASQQIVAAVRQEAAGIDQVGSAMEQINSATQQLVTATRQTEQANADLGRVAQRLSDGVDSYRLQAVD